MQCPRDGTSLARITLAGIELDKCHKCDGIWCDPGEMERFRDARVADVEEMVEQKYGDPAVEEGDVSGYMRCPACDDARLIGSRHTFLNPIRIDRCEKCTGLWLDDGELNAIIAEKRQLDAFLRMAVRETS